MFTQNSDILLNENPTASAGPKASFSEAFGTTFRDTKLNNSMLGAVHRFQEIEQQNMDQVYKLTGKRIRATFNPLSAMGVDNTPEVDAQGFDVSGQDHQTIQEIDKLATQYPGIKSYDQMLSQLRSEAQQNEAAAVQTGKRSGISGDLGSFAGGMAGSFTLNDPVNLITLPLAGFGRTIGMRMLTEGGINSAVQAVDEFTGHAQNRELLGLAPTTTGQKFEDVLMAGVGAALFRGLHEGAGLGLRKISDKLKAREPITDGDVRNAVADLPDQTPTTRAAVDLLDQEAALKDSIPFEKTRSAQAVHQILFRKAYNDLNQPFDPMARQGAAADHLDTLQYLRDKGVNPDDALYKAQDVLQQYGYPKNIDEATQIAFQEREPAIRQELIAEAANKLSKGEVKQLQLEQRDLQYKLDNLDKDLKQAVKGKNKQKGVTRKKSEQLARQDSAETRQTLEDHLRRVNEQLQRHDATVSADHALAQLDNGHVPERYKPMIEGRANELHAISEALSREKPIAPSHILNPKEHIAAIEDMENRVYDNLPQIVDKQVTTATKAMDAGEKVADLGLPEDVPLDMKIHTMDDSGNVTTKTVRDLLQETKDDDALIKAVRECSL